MYYGKNFDRIRCCSSFCGWLCERHSYRDEFVRIAFIVTVLIIFESCGCKPPTAV